MRHTHLLDSLANGSDERPLTWPGLTGHLRQAAARHGEQVIAEIPATMRRFRLLLAVAAVAVPAFLLGILVIVAMALHVHF
ncbi:MAG: hypothetical protein NVSMB32_00800 [Actinomycetota bacterium]